MKLKFLIISLCSVFLLQACGGTTVKRVDANEEIALTDKWNATDSRLVADTMMEDMLSFPWYTDFLIKGDERPRVIVQQIRNKSHEHVSVDTFINDIKRALLKNGKIDFVAAGDEREDIRAEREDQELNATAETANEMGQELGADFAMTGEINSFVDSLDNKRVTFYQVDLKLIDMLTNREVWIGQEKIQKVLEK